MKKFLRFLKSREAFPGIMTIINSICVYISFRAVGVSFDLTATIIYAAVLGSIAIVSLVFGYIIWQK